MEEEIDLQQYIRVVLKRKYLILGLALIMAVIMGVPGLNKKSAFEASAALLLKDSGAGSQSQVAGLQSLLGIKANTNDSGNFTILLNSRAVAERVMDDLKLTQRIKYWNDPNINKQNLIKSTQAMAKFSNKDGLFLIKAVTNDPALSADVANAFAKSGSELWNKLNYTEARKKREYIENQLPRVEGDLKRSEEALKRFSLISPAGANGIEFMRLQRECDIQNATYTMLRKEYESVKLEESKELDPYSMIDPALKPLSPMPNNVVFKFIIGLILGTLGGTLLAFILEKDRLFSQK